MSMKDSGVKWIGQIPEDWELVKIGSIFKCRNEKVNDTDYPPLSVTRNGIVPQMENVAKTDANDNRKMVKVNDFVINSRSDRKQSCGVSDLDGSVSLINTVLYTENTDVILPEYTNLLMKNYGFAEEFYRWGHGIVADLWTTRWQEMKNIVLPIPPIDIQSRIVRVLDRKISNVETLIANQQAQIEKLKEYKQAIITEAVTKGLDKSAPLKDSGIEWIGEIPESWAIKRAKYAATSIFKGNGITKEDIVVDGDTPCVRYGEIYSKYNISFRLCATRTNKSNLSVLQYFNYGDILFAGTGELVEEIGKNIVYLGNQECLAGGDIIVLRHQQNPAFLNYALYATYSQLQKSYGKAKLKAVHISASEIGNIFIALPSITEQQQIADYLDKKCTDIDNLIYIKQQKIDKLQEYKKSLIYEYVTGKKEVC